MGRDTKVIGPYENTYYYMSSDTIIGLDRLPLFNGAIEGIRVNGNGFQGYITPRNGVCY